MASPRTLTEAFDYLRAACMDPGSPVYGSDMVPAIDDLTLDWLRVRKDRLELLKAADSVMVLLEGLVDFDGLGQFYDDRVADELTRLSAAVCRARQPAVDALPFDRGT